MTFSLRPRFPHSSHLPPFCFLYACVRMWALFSPSPLFTSSLTIFFISIPHLYSPKVLASVGVWWTL